MHPFRSSVVSSSSSQSFSADSGSSLQSEAARSRGLPVSDLERLARAWGRAPDRWRGVVRHDPATRWYTLLHAGALYEIWLLGWTPGQGIELHDHGRAAGALFVAGGALLEQRPDPNDASRTSETLLAAGAVSTFGVGCVHALRNLGLENATSLHVYSPRLSRMTFFDAAPAGALAPRRTADLAVERTSWSRP